MENGIPPCLEKLKRGKITPERIEGCCRDVAALPVPLRTRATIALTQVLHGRDKAPSHAFSLYYAGLFTVIQKFAS